MDSRTAQVLSLLLIKRKLNNENPRTHRRWWVRPVNRNRERRGEFKRVMLELKMHDEEWFFSYARMTPTLFEELLSLIAPYLKKKSIRRPISASERLLITLRFLATGDSYFSLAQCYHIGKSTVCTIIQEVTRLLWFVLKPVVLEEPSQERLKEVSADFLNYWNVPHCVGSIDGKHIRVTAPGKSGSLYYNYKGYFSIILLGVCDAKYNFTYVDVGAYGSVSDGGVFSASDFGKKLNTKALPLPASEEIFEGIDMEYFFVGDAAFPLGENLMRPYSGTRLNIMQGVFNYRISRARRVIENAFGILTARWRIFHRAICAAPDNVENIIKATICLHNFIRKSLPARERYCPSTFVDNEDVLGKWREEVEGTIMNPCVRLGSNNFTNRAYIMRDNLAKYFLTPAGFKPGQIEYVKRT